MSRSSIPSVCYDGLFETKFYCVSKSGKNPDFTLDWPMLRDKGSLDGEMPGKVNLCGEEFLLKFS